MKIIERLQDNRRKALVECPQCLSQKTMDYHNVKHRTLDTDVCASCTLVNRNKSDGMKTRQFKQVDDFVKENNNKENGLYLLEFTEKRSKCKVQCKRCNHIKEIGYKKEIFTRWGCENCRYQKEIPKKERSQYYTKQLANTYGNMVQRTTNPKTEATKRAYMDRGITICKEWLEDRELFYKWSHENGYIENCMLSIDRKDNDKGYSPDNCRWTTKAIQARNTKKLGTNNSSGYRGVSLTQDKTSWRARITINNDQMHLGTFETPIEAAFAYDNYILVNDLEHTRNFD